jgi:hypothetical protein
MRIAPRIYNPLPYHLGKLGLVRPARLERARRDDGSISNCWVYLFPHGRLASVLRFEQRSGGQQPLALPLCYTEIHVDRVGIEPTAQCLQSNVASLGTWQPVEPPARVERALPGFVVRDSVR